jgi:hypothetical protein
VTGLAAALAVLAAMLFGAGTALQAHAADAGRPGPGRGGQAPTRHEQRSGTGVRSVVHLRALSAVMARPIWVAGTVLDGLGALTHIAALHFGPLTLVQPLSLAAIVFAVPAEALLSRRRPTSRQMAAATRTALGLGLIAWFLGRGLHSSHVGAGTSAAAVVVTAVGVGVLVLCAARRRSHRLQALLLGAAAGSAYGLSDALARAVQLPGITQFSRLVEILAVATALTVGAIGLLLTQAALQRSRLSASMPAQDLLALLVSIAMGAALLGEVPPLTTARVVGTLIALVLTGHGIAQLSQSLDQSVPALPGPGTDAPRSHGSATPHVAR